MIIDNDNDKTGRSLEIVAVTNLTTLPLGRATLLAALKAVSMMSCIIQGRKSG